MKCPRCGHWNKASLPHCFKCGEPLERQPEYLRVESTQWQYELKDDSENIYIQSDTEGDIYKLSDSRDSLAKEMANLKSRKRRGEQEQRRLREEGAKKGYAPSSRTIRQNTARDTFFNIDDNPSSTLRPMPPELVEDAESSQQRPASTEKINYSEPAQSNDNTKKSMYSSTARWQKINMYEQPGDTQPKDTLDDWAAPPQRLNARQVYDGFNDTNAYEPLWEEAHRKNNYVRTSTYSTKQLIPPRVGHRRALRIAFIVLLIGFIGMGSYIGISLWNQGQYQASEARKAEVSSSLNEDAMAAHTISIPGEEGDQIYIQETKQTYIVVGGVASVTISDYIWYENNESYQYDTMDVKLTPYLKTSSGQQIPMDPIYYQIDVPLSKLELITPDSYYVESSKAMYQLKFGVDPGSTVLLNGEDKSDMVMIDAKGVATITLNVALQPIGNNEFTITVRSQYHRERTQTLTIYREQQDIPIELSPNTPDRTTAETITIQASTLPGAIVDAGPNTNFFTLTTLNTNGEFSFEVKFAKYGNNTIWITAEYGDLTPSRIEHTIYYVPSPDIYTRIAWGLKDGGYANLLANISTRAKNNQIYEVQGTITQIISQKPQYAIIETGTEDNSQPIMVENTSQTVWELGMAYRLYADVYSTYGDMPWLIARYTYEPR